MTSSEYNGIGIVYRGKPAEGIYYITVKIVFRLDFKNPMTIWSLLKF